MIEYNIAIDNKVWENLSGFENGVLKNVIHLNDITELKKRYYSKGKECFKMVIAALHILKAENLLFLTTENMAHNKIENFQFLNRLEDEYNHIPKINSSTSIGSSGQMNKKQ